jgi:hypothetical protein
LPLEDRLIADAIRLAQSIKRPIKRYSEGQIVENLPLAA